MNAPHRKIILDKENKVEIRVYDGDEDPNILNRKRIGVYLFKRNEFIASEWIECGKLIGNIIVNDPKMTLKKKEERTNIAIENLKNIWSESNGILE